MNNYISLDRNIHLWYNNGNMYLNYINYFGINTIQTVINLPLLF